MRFQIVCRSMVLYTSFWWWCCCCEGAWYIAPPAKAADWTKLSKLVVETFHTPASDASWMEQMRWTLYEKDLVQRAFYVDFVKNAKRMKGNKYNIFIAKEADEVIGIAEIGLRSLDGDDKRPTIGMICVSKDFRQQGIGAGLVQRCQRLVDDVWDDNKLFAEVEEQNLKALSFFNNLGFQVENNKTAIVTVRRKLDLVERPHLILSKPLKNHKNQVV